MEEEGWAVHWPPRDTDQNDSVGLQICRDNRTAIDEADRVFIVWDGISQGCLFDLGMAFALSKPVTLLAVPLGVAGEKSFERMVRAWADGFQSSHPTVRYRTSPA